MCLHIQTHLHSSMTFKRYFCCICIRNIKFHSFFLGPPFFIRLIICILFKQWHVPNKQPINRLEVSLWQKNQPEQHPWIKAGKPTEQAKRNQASEAWRNHIAIGREPLLSEKSVVTKNRPKIDRIVDPQIAVPTIGSWCRSRLQRRLSFSSSCDPYLTSEFLNWPHKPQKSLIHFIYAWI